MEKFRQDLRFALRVYAKNRSFTIIAVLAVLGMLQPDFYYWLTAFAIVLLVKGLIEIAMIFSLRYARQV